MSFNVLVAVIFASVLAGCPQDKADPPNNGVDDVKQACEIRAAWTKYTDRVCINCMSAAPSAACDCPDFKAFGGKCQAQNDTRRAQPQCTDAIANCARACPRTDCACVDACYANAPDCKTAEAAVDGCVADVCAQYCQ